MTKTRTDEVRDLIVAFVAERGDVRHSTIGKMIDERMPDERENFGWHIHFLRKNGFLARVAYGVYRIRPKDESPIPAAQAPETMPATDYQKRLRRSMCTAINDARRREAKKGAKGGHCANVTVTIDQVMARLAAQNWRCAISGQPFWFCGEKYGPSIPSIDRINPDGDYSADNIRVTLLGVNSMRGRGTDVDMYRIAEAIITSRKGASK